MTDEQRQLIFYVALVIGSCLAVVSLFVWVVRGDFGPAGASFLSFGCLLIGLSVFTKASIKAGPIEAAFEGYVQKRFSALSSTDAVIEQAVREHIQSLDASEILRRDSEESGQENVLDEQSLRSVADSILDDVRARAFLTIDTRPFLGSMGDVVRVPYSDFESIGLLLRYAWFLVNELPPHSYTKNWLIREATTGKVFRKVGSRFARAQLGTKWDNRSLEVVGIYPGGIIQVIPVSKER